MSGPALQNAAPAGRPVAEKCAGCDRVVKETQRCSAFSFPDAKWRLGPCAMATHIKAETSKTAEKVRVGQQKQKKK